MNAVSAKDPSLAPFLDAVRTHWPSWVVVDYWSADLCATGVARADDSSRLVYVSTFELPRGRFYFECEVSDPGHATNFRTVSQGHSLALDELLRVIGRHFEQPAR